MPEKIKINLDQPAFLIDGTKVVYGNPDGKLIDATWAFLAYKAVAAKYPDDQGLDFKASYDRGKLASRLFKGGDIELTDESLKEIKRLFAKAYNADHLVGFVIALGLNEE